MTTIILLNPMGTDVTPFVTGAAMVPQLLKGTIRKPGDTVITIPYVNQPGRQNVADGVELLHAAILNAIANGATDILVFGYSEGCQIADWWLWKYGQSTPVDPSLIRFWLIANANRKYGGFVYGHSIFDAVGYTQGKPANTPYRVIDFTRQYDGVSDFPTAQPIQNALVGLQTVGSDQNALSGAMNAVATVLADNVHKTAALNAISGLVLIHNIYLYVTLDDPANLSLTEGNITWVWSPTYPVPMLGLATAFASSDRERRLLIEQAHQRPVQIPMPNYGLGPAWGQPAAPVPAGAVTGWWAPIRAARGKSSGAYLFTGLEAAGLRRPRATTGAAFMFSGSAIGRRLSQAVAAAGQYGFVAGAAVGDDNVRQASAAGVYNFAGTAVGMSSQGKGSGSGVYNFASGAVLGRRTPKASGPGSYSFGGSATGRRAPRAAAAGAYVFAGAAVGRKIARAVAAGAYNFAGAAIGRVTRKASAAGGYTFAGSATGVRPSTFTPFNEENQSFTNKAVPLGCAGVWVTLIGAGGGGGNGYIGGGNRGGGGGGGGGAKIFRVFIPVADLGPNYSVTWAAGASAADGADAVFSSGSRVLTAGGGGRGGNGSGSAGGSAGSAGTATVTNVSGASTANGTAGSAGAFGGNPSNPVNNTAGGGPGGGGGSRTDTFGNMSTSAKGGDSVAASGGAGRAANSGVVGAAGGDGGAGMPGGGGSGGAGFNSGGTVNGRAGGKGGNYGAGGGGGSAGTASTAPGGAGGDCYSLLEWVATAA